MSWGEIFFSFHGRINRKTYWFASVLLIIVGAFFAALLSYLATGNPIATEVWGRASARSSLWIPVWLAYFAFLFWPSSALAVKRLHDRDLPSWLWYLYYAASILLTILNPGVTQTTPAAAAAITLILIFQAYVIVQLGFLRGAPGYNRYGDDTMPVGYYGGDYNFWSWMFAVEGRISRSKWWLGLLIVATAITAAIFLLGFLTEAFFERYPTLEQHLSDPEWANSNEAAPILIKFLLWSFAPSVILLCAIWSFLALGIKRLHDRGLSSWLIFVVVLPAIGALISPAMVVRFGFGENLVILSLLLLTASVIWSLLQFGILKGQTGPNDFGPDPLAGRGK